MAVHKIQYLISHEMLQDIGFVLMQYTDSLNSQPDVYSGRQATSCKPQLCV